MANNEVTYSEFVASLSIDTLTGSEKIALVDSGGTKYTTTSAIRSLYFFNPMDFGAVGDGVTDDTAAFEAAYAALVIAGSGTIFSPAKSFVVSGLVFVTSNMIFEGSGDGTKFILKANANTDVICDGDAVTAQENVHYRNFMIDGNKSNQPSSGSGLPGAERCGLRLRHDSQTVYNVSVEGIYTYGTKQNGISVESTNYCNVTNNRSEYNDNHGIWWENGNNVNVTNNWTAHNTLAGYKVLSAGEGSFVGNQSKSDRNVSFSFQSAGRISIIGNKAYRPGWHYDDINDEAAFGFAFSASDSCNVIGNSVFGSQGGGFSLNGTTRTNFIGNNFRRNGQKTDNTYADISITNAGGGSNNSNNFFSGNTFRNDTDVNYPNVAKYNVDFVQTNSHLGNTFTDNNFGAPTTAKTHNLNNSDATPLANNNILGNNTNLNPHKAYSYGYLDPTPATIDPLDGDYLIGTGYNSTTTVNIADGLIKGQQFYFQYNQDTGNKVITWAANVKWSGGTAPTLATAASAFNIIHFTWDGTNWNGAPVADQALLNLKAPLASPTFTGTVTLADTVNIVLNATTGTQIGTATTQKLGFYAAAPIVQRASANQAAVVGTASTNVAPYGYSQAQADAIITLVNELRTAMVNLGLIKGSA